jgi:hypothetical protein
LVVPRKAFLITHCSGRCAFGIEVPGTARGCVEAIERMLFCLYRSGLVVDSLMHVLVQRNPALKGSGSWIESLLNCWSEEADYPSRRQRVETRNSFLERVKQGSTRMATMVMAAPQTPLPTSNGHAVNGTEEGAPGGIHIDISALEESYEEPCNQVVPHSQFSYHMCLRI